MKIQWNSPTLNSWAENKHVTADHAWFKLWTCPLSAPLHYLLIAMTTAESTLSPHNVCGALQWSVQSLPLRVLKNNSGGSVEALMAQSHRKHFIHIQFSSRSRGRSGSGELIRPLRVQRWPQRSRCNIQASLQKPRDPVQMCKSLACLLKLISGKNSLKIHLLNLSLKILS